MPCLLLFRWSAHSGSPLQSLNVFLHLQRNLDQYGTIKCINFVRRQMHEKHTVRSVLDKLNLDDAGHLADDVNLKPFLLDDGLLLLDYEDERLPSISRCAYLGVFPLIGFADNLYVVFLAQDRNRSKGCS